MNRSKDKYKDLSIDTHTHPKFTTSLSALQEM